MLEDGNYFWNSGIFLFFEETEFCYRAKQKKLFCYQINSIKTKTIDTTVKIDNNELRQKWQYLVKDIEEFAKQEDCKMLELIARPGWQKVLNNFGYKKTHVVLEKQIKQEDKI